MTADQQKVIQYWRDSAERDLLTARDLLKLKHRGWALFIYHLAIEKLLKALVVKAGITPPYTHDLEKLALRANLRLAKTYKKWLEEITDFNLEARYPSDKRLFYQKATESFTKIWSKHCEEIYQWLTKRLD